MLHHFLIAIHLVLHKVHQLVQCHAATPSTMIIMIVDYFQHIVLDIHFRPQLIHLVR